jgi:hypothetical protein
MECEEWLLIKLNGNPFLQEAPLFDFITMLWGFPILPWYRFFLLRGFPILLCEYRGIITFNLY